MSVISLVTRLNHTQEKIDTVYNFVNSMIKESKYCNEVTKKHSNKELLMTKEANEDFKNSTKCWICDNDYIDGDVKVTVIPNGLEK